MLIGSLKLGVLERVALFCLFLMIQAFAVSGIAVCTKDGSRALQYYGTMDGQLYRHNIVNDVVTGHTKLFDGPCSEPRINPAGTKIAFIKGSKISVINIDGGPATELCDAHQNAQVDFPTNDWIYFVPGSFHEDGSKPLKRVNVNSKTVENVVTFSWRVSQLFVSSDQTSRAVMRVGDCCGTVTGTIIAYTLPGNGTAYQDRGGGSSWSCAAGLFSDGVNLMDGDQDPHESMVIRRWDNGSQVATYNNNDALNWPPNSGANRPSSMNHAIFHTGAATNHPDWACVAMGGSRDYAWDRQVLINWKDHRCIVASQGLTGKFDHGDFWVGTVTAVDHGLSPKPIGKESFERVAVSRRNGWIAIEAGMTCAVEVIDLQGRIANSVQTGGSGRLQIRASSGLRFVRITDGESGKQITRAIP